MNGVGTKIASFLARTAGVRHAVFAMLLSAAVLLPCSAQGPGPPCGIPYYASPGLVPPPASQAANPAGLWTFNPVQPPLVKPVGFSAQDPPQPGSAPVPSPAPQQISVPVWPEPELGALKIQSANGRVSLVVRNAPLNHVVSVVAQSQGLNLVCAEDISASVSIVLQDVAWSDALTAVLSTAGYTWAEANGIVHVTSIASGKNLAPGVQGRLTRVFPLDYAAGDDVEKAVKGLLSPVGQVFLTASSPTDLRKTKDAVLVEDLPAYMDRIAQYIAQVDRPPRQVLIEAQVLEIRLEDNDKFGVNFDHLFSLAGAAGELQLRGMVNPLTPQSFFVRLSSGSLDALVECLKDTTDAKTLASPRVLVVDGQEARIQVGQKLPYRVTTTTETSTMENVQFLDIGVVLMVTPHISRDGRVLMTVKPKVSSGHIRPDTELPEEKTSEVESNVLLEDGQGIIIGGLIQEKDSNTQSKIPILGDLWLVGLLFQKRNVEKYRAETIIALVPRIQPLCGSCAADDLDVQRCQTPLFDQQFNRIERPWAARLPDALAPPRFAHGCTHGEPHAAVQPPCAPLENPCDVHQENVPVAPEQTGEPSLPPMLPTDPQEPSQPGPEYLPSSPAASKWPQQDPGAAGRVSVTRLPPINAHVR